jgi:molybdenum cofactor synthesis domain-containing protein
MTDLAPPRQAALLVIGDEILSGRTQDTNLGTIARFLGALGIKLAEARVVSDIEAEIVAAVNALRSRYDYVFTTGGIGPTHDDITADAIARAFGVGISERADALAILEAHYPPGMLNAARRRMARIPDGADLIENPVSKAPGIAIENVFVMAGVPAVMAAMLESLRHKLIGGPPLLSRTLSAYLAEGAMAEALGAIQADFADVSIGSYPFYRANRFGASLVFRGRDNDLLDQVADRLRGMIRALGADPIEGDPPLV